MFCGQCGNHISQETRFCTSCGAPASPPKHEPDRNEPEIYSPQSQVNTHHDTSQQSIEFENLDTTLDEIKMISVSRKQNSANSRKALLFSIPTSITISIFAFLQYNYSDMKEYYLDWTWFWDMTLNFEQFKIWFYPHTDDYFSTNSQYITWTPGVYFLLGGFFIAYLVLYYYFGYRAQSLGKGGILRANSLISSFEESVQRHSNYPRRGEFNLVKSEFEAATKAAGIFGAIVGIIIALFAILAIFSSRDNDRRY